MSYKQNRENKKKVTAKESDSKKKVTAKESDSKKKLNESINDKKEKLQLFRAVYPDGINGLDEKEPEWEELDMAVDSGATEHVGNEEMLKNIKLEEGEAYKKGVQYEVASGTLIPNLGEKKFVAVTDNGLMRKMKIQICDVNKALMSVKRIARAGNRVVFDDEYSYIEDKATGEHIPLKEEGGMYMLKLWVRKTQEGF